MRLETIQVGVHVKAAGTVLEHSVKRIAVRAKAQRDAFGTEYRGRLNSRFRAILLGDGLGQRSDIVATLVALLITSVGFPTLNEQFWPRGHNAPEQLIVSAKQNV